MPKPYSYDLRQKVIQAIQLDGLKITEASLVFSISRNTIRLWLKRERETGDFQALPTIPKVAVIQHQLNSIIKNLGNLIINKGIASI
jgi:transposase-like protein